MNKTYWNRIWLDGDMDDDELKRWIKPLRGAGDSQTTQRNRRNIMEKLSNERRIIRLEETDSAIVT